MKHVFTDSCKYKKKKEKKEKKKQEAVNVMTAMAEYDPIVGLLES